ncbi:MAG TPA: DNA repair exonuclease [Desulfobulbaceae bacterium]|nr:DNA repair exonuclease [Desulfobulbaceae bacterium]
MRFIHAADIHLDSPLQGLEAHEGAPVEEIREATRRAFTNLIDLALEEKVDFVLIAGDLYDGDWKDYNTGLFFVGRIGRLARAGIQTFIVAGNHDAASQITRAMPLPANVTLLSAKKPQSITLARLGVIIHGQSYAARAVNENLAAYYPQGDPNYFNIGLLHTSLTGRVGHENYAPCTLADLKSKGYDYWALGHVHQREIVAEDPWIVYPGNIQGRHIRESGSKGATLVTVEEGRVVEVEERELDVLRWVVCPVELSECETREAVYGRVSAALEKAQSQAEGRILALRLQLQGNCPLHGDLHARSVLWTEEFRGIATGLGDIWLERVQLATMRRTLLNEVAGKDTPLADLLQAVAELEFAGASLTTLVPDLASLKTKLPPELLAEGSVLEGSPECLPELREEVKELLIAKLIQHGGEA